MMLQKRAKQLIKEHGSIRKASKAIGISSSLLGELSTGNYTKHPGDGTLIKMGLQCKVTYKYTRIK